MIHHYNHETLVVLVLFTVPFYRFSFSRYLKSAERHFSSDILVPFPIQEFCTAVANRSLVSVNRVLTELNGGLQRLSLETETRTEFRRVKPRYNKVTEE